MAIDPNDATLQDRLVTCFGSTVNSLRRLVSTDDLLHHGGIMALATVVAGSFNYTYQVFMGRALGPEQFGIFGALFAVFYLVNVLGRGIRFCASRFAAEFDSTDPGLTSFYRGLILRATAFSVLLFAGLIATSPFIGAFLGIESSLLVLLALTSVPVGLILTANQGALQGLQWFGPLGGYKILLAAVKLTVGVVLVVLGYGVYGAFGAVVLATFLVLAVSTIHLFWRLPIRAVSPVSVDYHRAYRYTVPAAIAGFCITVPGTVDVIIVQHTHPGTQAGLYAAVAVLGKILIFLPLGICAALFPKVSRAYSTGDNQGGVLMRALLYAGGIAASGAVLFILLPELVLGLFFGQAYVGGASLLRWYALAILAFALAIVLLNFELARDRTRYVYVFSIATVFEIGLLWVVADSPVGLAQVILTVNTALFVYGIYEVKP